MSWLDDDDEFVTATSDTTRRGLAVLGAKERHAILCLHCCNTFEVDVPILTRVTIACPTCGALCGVRG